jgi:MYXO-CTERM domain-containing protein
MAYDRYRDKNGVTWTVVWPAGKKRFEAIATVEDTAQPKYDPEAADITASMSQGGVQFFGLDIVPSDQATGEQQRTLFIELVGKIEQYASEHTRNTSLKVTPSDDGGHWGWLVALGLLVVGMRSKRRR